MLTETGSSFFRIPRKDKNLRSLFDSVLQFFPFKNSMNDTLTMETVYYVPFGD